MIGGWRLLDVPVSRLQRGLAEEAASKVGKRIRQQAGRHFHLRCKTLWTMRRMLTRSYGHQLDFYGGG